MSRMAVRADRIFDGERVLDETVVLVEDGLITATTREVPEGWPIHEVPGGTVVPGLIDAHVHLSADAGPGALDRLAESGDDTIEQSLRIHLQAGVTTVRDLGDRNDAVLDWRRRGLTGLPTVVAAGTPLTSVGGHCWSLGGEVAGPDEMRAAVHQRADKGADVIKIMASGGVLTPGSDTMSPQFTEADLAVAVAAAHEVGLPITAHAHALSAVRQALAVGVDGIEHCTCLTPTGVAIDEELLAALAASGIAVCGTLGSDPSIVVPPAILDLVAKAGISEAALQQAVRRLSDGGVRIVAGSDGGIGPAKPHGLLPATLAEYVHSGLSATAALTAATSAAADALGLGDRKGRLRSGADADLVLVDGDPTADITTLARPVAVYLAGRQA
ncbi:amidohydrolase family protein [Kribbella sp. NPDC055071]